MATCEMCGAQQDPLIKVRIAGSEMNVCNACKHMGTEIDPKPQEYSHTFKRSRRSQETIEEVTNDYQKLIQSALVKKSFNLHQLARAINIKESTLNNYLKGTIKPALQDARKIEQFLEIKLIIDADALDDDYEDFTAKEDTPSNTLGDMLLKELNKQ